MNRRDAVLLLLLLLCGCASAQTGERRAPAARPESAGPAQVTTPAPSARPATAGEAAAAVNRKYNLTCLFREDSDGIEYVTLRDDATGEQARYQPSRQTGVTEEGGAERYHRDVWSPDGEYLALPLSPSGGFCIIKSGGALKAVKQRRCDDFIRVLDYRPAMEVKRVALFHEWVGWEGDAAFGFKAGLHGDRKMFVYDTARKELYDGAARDADYLSYLKERVAKDEAREVGASKKGRVEITDSFRKP